MLIILSNFKSYAAVIRFVVAHSWIISSKCIRRSIAYEIKTVINDRMARHIHSRMEPYRI